MKALVTGAAGFIGSTLSRALIAEGVEVVGVDAFTDYYNVGLKRLNVEGTKAGGKGFHLIEADLADMDTDALLADVDVVFHQAGQPGVRASWGAEFEQYTRNNVTATQRLLESAMRSTRLTRFVYASSSSVYGNSPTYPTSEQDVPAPMSPYGVTKLAAEHLCSLYARNFGVPTVSLRYFTVYGPRQRPDMAFTRFCTAAASDQPITLYGDGEQIRDFTYVDDVVRANMLAAERGVPAGSVINVAGGTSVSVNEVLEIVSELRGKPLNILREDKVPGDVFRTGGSVDRANELLGWKPDFTLEEGLRLQYEWATKSAL